MALTDQCKSFQNTVGEYLVRHRSILDTLSKFQESSSRVNRATIKAVTTCGCVKIEAKKLTIPESMLIEDYKALASSHISGMICEHCKEIIESELGNHLFYLAAICELLDLSMHEVMEKEKTRVATLGYFKMS
ncbi:MAG: DUF1573 domain-containing protein [bacterium]|nr:DUF1573 domain-containing protein [bacterium]